LININIPKQELKMIVLSITEIVKKPSVLLASLKIGEVKIVWKEQKPNGKVVFEAKVQKIEGGKNEIN
jgi:hypothetical protein